ncbi:hypothetical protein J1N35_015747 [Gossypium stocksii]|uniref:DUF7745 domain-containing protein n=1 Tax=Gossypium stocksii TaxID=47602 RepID=A0A9D4AAZ8_9ROSI|nr:hypothetical protein J1N35_015747 [Gossypium stocksii]
MNITGISKQWVTARIKQKGECKCIPWKALKDLILTHLDEKKKVTPVPAILAETFQSLNACRRAGEGRFIGCAQLLLVWFHSHFRKVNKVSYQAFFKNYSPLKEILAAPWRDDILEENWIVLLRNLQEDDVEWRAPWLVPDEVLYQCRSFDWVPLLGIWGAVGYTHLLVLRQYRSRQFISATHGLAQCEFSYKGDRYKKLVKSRRVNDNIPVPSLEGARPIEEYLRVVPSELEIMKQDFETRSSKFRKQIERLEE